MMHYKQGLDLMFNSWNRYQRVHQFCHDISNISNALSKKLVFVVFMYRKVWQLKHQILSFFHPFIGWNWWRWVLNEWHWPKYCVIQRNGYTYNILYIRMWQQLLHSFEMRPQMGPTLLTWSRRYLSPLTVNVKVRG